MLVVLGVKLKRVLLLRQDSFTRTLYENEKIFYLFTL